MTDPIWLDEAIILAIHASMIERYGGSPGIRDEGLLASAMNRPRNRWAYETPELVELAAAYAFGISSNHPFIDGNKRTGLMAAYTFLRLNGYRLVASEPEAVVMIRDLAAGEIDEAAIAAWIAASAEAV